jgi:exonuclease SbcD
VVAGDLYDRALPPVDAVRLADDAFARLAASRAQVVVTSGNHDSAHRLGFGSRLIDAAGVFIRADIAAVGRPVLLADEHGPVAVHALPYLDPDAVREPWGLPARSHEAAIAEAMRRVRADLSTRPAGTRSVVVAHAFVAGAQPSDSERDIAVGGVSRVPVSLFDGIDYTALGHLHGRQVLTDRVRYSGSPLAYSFSEDAHVKGTWLVDLDTRGFARASFVPAPVPRPLARLRGDLEHLLVDPTLSQAEAAWVQVTLTDDIRPLRAMERLRGRFPHALVLAFEPAHPPAGETPVARAAGRSDHEVTLDFVAELRGVPATPAESELIGRACAATPTDVDVELTGV